MRIVDKQTIRKPNGTILGYIETDQEGNQTARDFSGKILGYYDKRSDLTRDFYGRVTTYGNSVIGFLYK